MAGDHGSQGPIVMGICIAFAILTFIVLTLRLFARIYVLGKMGLDDCKPPITQLLFRGLD